MKAVVWWPVAMYGCESYMCLLNRRIFELEFMRVEVMTITSLGLKVKVISQGQMSMSGALGVVTQ